MPRLDLWVLFWVSFWFLQRRLDLWALFGTGAVSVAVSKGVLDATVGSLGALWVGSNFKTTVDNKKRRYHKMFDFILTVIVTMPHCAPVSHCWSVN